MALDGSTMGNAVADFVLAQAGDPLSDAEKASVRANWVGICTAIVNHITSNGAVNPGTFMDAESRAISGQGTIE